MPPDVRARPCSSSTSTLSPHELAILRTSSVAMDALLGYGPCGLGRHRVGSLRDRGLQIELKRNFAFVQFSTTEEASRALEALNNTKVPLFKAASLHARMNKSTANRMQGSLSRTIFLTTCTGRGQDHIGRVRGARQCRIKVMDHHYHLCLPYYTFTRRAVSIALVNATFVAKQILHYNSPLSSPAPAQLADWSLPIVVASPPN